LKLAQGSNKPFRVKGSAPLVYRFGQAAAALGVPEQRLRNWLHRHKEIDLFGSRPQGGWRSFTEEDLFVLAVAARLFAYGCPFVTAVNEVRCALDAKWLVEPAKAPPFLFAAETASGWCATTDENLLWAYNGRHLTDLVRISLPQLFAEVRRRVASPQEGQ
jgi:hypothetical protein